MKIKIFILFTILTLLFGCDYFTLLSNKEWRNKNDKNELDVYVAGYVYYSLNNEKPVVWKNNELNELESINGITRIYAMDIYNDDIYCGGFCDDPDGLGVGTPSKACYWINNKIKIVEISNLSDSIINSIKIINGVIYSAGYDNNRACYWINEKIYYLDSPGTSSQAKSIYIDKETNDFYIAGYYTIGGNYPCYWKNGKECQSIGISGGSANSIYHSNDNLYIAGLYTSNTPGYWINNKFNLLNYGGAGSIYTNGIKVYNGNVYTTGSIFIPPSNLKIFKNNIEISVPVIQGESNSIYIFNDDIYVCGRNTSNQAAYWKNGSVTNLVTNTSYAYEVIVRYRN